MAKVVIIGAGLTGLSAAYHLENAGFFDYILCEKEENVGGLCRSVEQDGFTFDFTGHLLHASDPYFQKFISSVVGLEQFNTINRRSFIYSHETFTRYPFQINLHGLPIDVITECIEGYLNRTQSREKPKNFVQWVLQNFGPGFAKHFFMPFQSKIFAYDLRHITASWTGRFVPQTSLKQMLTGALTDNFDESIGYNAHFYYPKKGGIQSWIDALAKKIIKPILTNFAAQQIDLNKKIITFANGQKETFTHIINTTPLDNFIASVKEPSSTAFYAAQRKLLCNQVINFNLGIARENLTDKHWIYFPEKQFPFYRIGFPHNFSTHMAPEQHSSLYGELSFVKTTIKNQQNLIDNALKETKKLFKLRDEEIVCNKIIHIKHAYVIYNKWREQNLKSLLERLQEHQIFSTGRYGAWKYASMQEAVLDGKQVAETILNMRNDKHKQLGGAVKIAKEASAI